LNRIALSARFEIRYYVVENWEEAIEAVRTGKADLIPASALRKNARANSVSGI
jgi:ABC-type amino acid transport substrate-binding protein